LNPKGGKLAYQVLALKYRPSEFDEVVAQEAIARTLKRAIEKNRIANAYLFAGIRGTGKTTLARIFARALNCEKGPTPSPCGKCASCVSILRGDDIDVLEIDAASNRKIDDIRNLRQNVKYLPSHGRFRIYIIDEVHMLVGEAFNALLKTLEEPPPHAKFILATTAPDKIPETVRSRCQRYDFKPIPEGEILKRLEHIARTEGAAPQDGVLELLARRATGSLRDAIYMLDQLISFCGEKISLDDVATVLGLVSDDELFELFNSLSAKDLASSLKILDRALVSGKELGSFLREALGYLRDLMVYISAKGSGVNEASSSRHQQFEELKSKFSLPRVLYFASSFSQVLRDIRFTTQGRVLVELVLAKLARSDEMEEVSRLLERLKSLEERLAEIPGQSEAGNRRAEPPARPTARVGQPRGASGHLREAELMPKVLDELGKRNMRLRAFLREGRVVEASRDGVVIEFDRGFRFHRENLEREENRSVIEESFEAALGRKVRVTYRTREESGRAQAEQSQPAEHLKQEPEEARLVRKFFPGRIEED